MYAISFDLVVADTAQNHPKGVSQAYADIGSTLHKYGFDRIQGSLYTCQTDNKKDGTVSKPSRHLFASCLL